MRLGFSFSELGRGLTGNLSAQAFALFVQLIVALVSVPVFAGVWGLEAFGIWLILYTLPAYLVLADLGYPGAAANEMTALVAKGEEQRAVALFRAITGTTIIGAILFFLALSAILGAIDDRWLSFADEAAEGRTREIVMLFAAFAVFGIIARAFLGALRATGHYAKGAYLIGATALLNLALAALLALLGGGLVGAALGYAIGEACGLFGMWRLVNRYAPPFQPRIWPSNMALLLPLTHPAIALVTVAVGHALMLQGVVAALGIAAGAAAVPAYVATRTLSRMGIQSVGVVSLAVMPELTVARARQDSSRSADLVAINLASALILLVPGALILAIWGPQIVSLWSGGVIEASRELAVLMAMAMLIGGLWGPLASFLTSENRQGRFAPAYAIFMLLGVALAFVLAQVRGASGAALAMLAVDLAMLAWTFVQAKKTGFIDSQSLKQALPRLAAIARRRWSKG